MAEKRKTILVDFDGTINSDRTPFDPEGPEQLPDPPLPGAIAFLRRLAASQVYEPVIFTTRALNKEAMKDNYQVVQAVRNWLQRHGLETPVAQGMRVTAIKVPCRLIIDDNAWRFQGTYPTPDELAKLTAKKHG